MPACSRCESAVPLDATYCPKCGTRLRGAGVEAPLGANDDALGRKERVGGVVWYLSVAGFLVGIVILLLGLPGAVKLNLVSIAAVIGGGALAFYSRRLAVRIRDGQQRKIDE